MDKLNKETSASAGDSTIAMAEDAGCQYCDALKQVNDPEEGNCQYCVAMDGAQAGSSLENCKYCAASDVPGTDCQYCNRPEMAQPGPNASDCQYCSDMAHRDQECQYCGQGPSTKNPTTTDSQDFAGQGLNSPEIDKPILGEDPQKQITPMDDTTNNNLALDAHGQGESNVHVSAGAPMMPGAGPKEGVQIDQSKEAMRSIAQQIENDPIGTGIGNGPGPEGAQQAMATDEAALVGDPNMIDGVSRPEGFADNVPGDMGLGEENAAIAPDLTSVLHEGLDSHADNIQRERVVQMVSEALSGFKASKQIIERAQQQAPQLYSSSIMMLKAMIEMAKMLGLSENNPAADGVPDAQGEWQNPFPTHPDQGGAPALGHAPSEGSASKDGDQNTGNEWSNPFPTHAENGGAAPADSPVGQPIGKLPTSATTPHVARTPLAPGSVNAQGQKKYVDPVTGKESFINMKEGRVLSPTGKPVKPEQG